jgi:hypothetical protein
MQIRNSLSDKKEIYSKTFILANLFLIFSVIMFSIYLGAPLLGGKLSVKALTHYGSWTAMAIGIRIVSQRGRKGLKIRAYEYLIVCLVAIVNFAIWFSYPINIILSILIIVGTAISYRAHNKRMSQGAE